MNTSLSNIVLSQTKLLFLLAYHSIPYHSNPFLNLPHLSLFFSFSAPRRYLPLLRGFPAEYIYDPWNAPEEVQKAAKCIIGVHYPKPMVNHAEASRINIERMKQIYQQLSCYRGLGKDITHILITSNLHCHSHLVS